MKRQTYIFNVCYRDDIYGVEAYNNGDTYYCKQIKYQVDQIYQPKIKKALEQTLADNPILREDFLGGWIVIVKVKEE